MSAEQNEIECDKQIIMLISFKDDGYPWFSAFTILWTMDSHHSRISLNVQFAFE